jgi:ATP-binding cassette subfamily G (WHITE) protein 2
VGISLNELHGLKLTCTDKQLVNGRCPVSTGEQTIKNLGLDYISIGGCAGVLIGYIVFCRVVAYLGVRFIKH